MLLAYLDVRLDSALKSTGIASHFLSLAHQKGKKSSDALNGSSVTLCPSIASKKKVCLYELQEEAIYNRELSLFSQILINIITGRLARNIEKASLYCIDCRRGQERESN